MGRLTRQLGGSSIHNPWILEDEGGLILSEEKEKEQGWSPGELKRLKENIEVPRKNHPSLIRQDIPRWHPGRRPGKAKAPAPPSKPPIRVRYLKGKRDARAKPLQVEDLYVGHARPPVRAAVVGHVCCICGGVKSHPVRNKCGHSYCYVCIRLRLEREWTCPAARCSRLIRKAPVKDVGELESIQADYAASPDESAVLYTWDGLRFPNLARPIVLSPPSSPF
ncbi:hypothetical protein C8R47DRAFT_1220480 [Mycena vitilis]|nr:hypothetical protein C8R47DRAFT_1220480 [Mycena vitilis]